jgi:hypothetical protein
VLTSETVEPNDCRKKRSARVEMTEVESPGAGLP